MSRMRVLAGAAGMAGIVAMAGCASDPAVHDTGYRGTWARGNDRVTSTIALYADEESGPWRVRWTKVSDDRKFRVTCDWDGNCKETLLGRTVATMAFRIWRDEANGHLRVRVQERRLEPEVEELVYEDELVLENGNLSIRAYTRERGGERIEGDGAPSRAFEKVADSVAFPPRSRIRS